MGSDRVRETYGRSDPPYSPGHRQEAGMENPPWSTKDKTSALTPRVPWLPRGAPAPSSLLSPVEEQLLIRQAIGERLILI